MEDKILVLGKEETARCFREVCEKAGIAVVQSDSFDNIDSYLKDAAVIVQFSEEGSSVPDTANSYSIKAWQTWLSESLDRSATAMAERMSDPERYAGFSLSGLFPEKKMIELIAAEKTSDNALTAARTLFEKLQFTVVISRDHPGHVLHRVVAAMINEAIYVNMYGLARMEDIDQMMKLAANFPMGPFEYADYLGLDRVLKTLEWLTEELGPQYRPCPLLRRKVEAGFLGRKTRRGFYTY
jgi:hypothetical protein